MYFELTENEIADRDLQMHSNEYIPDNWSIGSQREVDTWVWHQVSLELSQIHIEGTIEPEGGGDGGHNLGDQSVQVGVGGTLNV